MKKKINIIVGIIIAMFIGICIALILMDSNIKVGYAGNKTANRMNASFQYFDAEEDKKINLEKGEQLSIFYELNNSKGELILQLLDEDMNIIETREDTEGDFQLAAESSQKYTIRVTGTKAKGSYSVKWEKGN